jgi:hypothetical protein
MMAGMQAERSDAELNASERAMLEYLRKHSGGSGERISLDPKPIRRDLRLSAGQFDADATSLAAHGFAGVRGFRSESNPDVPTSGCSAIWVTRKGEDYLRRTRPEPTLARAGQK